jgi:hypothetical protein
MIVEWVSAPHAYSSSSGIVIPLTAETRAIQEDKISPWIGRGARGSGVNWQVLPGVIAFQK